MKSPAPGPDPAFRRTARVIFLTLFVAYSYFHQGGGWNQNIRFDQVRSLVEDRSWSVNRFSVYEPCASRSGGTEICRRPLPVPIPDDLDLRRLNSWDISLYDGRIYPNKPPGTTLLAAPAYALGRGLGRLAGLDPDGWQGLAAALYLTTALSIGLLGALGGVIFLHLSRRLFPELELRHHAAATLAFGLGTIYFPFATMLFDHVAVAVTLAAGFALVLAAAEPAVPQAVGRRLFAAGALLGLAVVVNYTAVVAVALIVLYGAGCLAPRHRLLYLIAGGLPPALFLAAYHRAAFGSLLANANSHQLSRYQGEGTLLFGMFGLPDPRAVVGLLISDYRGLFFYSPVLLLALYGSWTLFRQRRRRREAALGLAVFAAFLALNASFNNWHAGATFGPRYLIPALPFLALPLAVAFARRRLATAAVAVLSAAIVFVGTATLPLVHHSAEHPLIDPVLLGFLGRSSLGAVSQNPMGIYELAPYTHFAAGSFVTRWNAWNLGEALFPGSRLSLLPLLVVIGLGTALVLRRQVPKTE